MFGEHKPALLRAPTTLAARKEPMHVVHAQMLSAWALTVGKDGSNRPTSAFQSLFEQIVEVVGDNRVHARPLTQASYCVEGRILPFMPQFLIQCRRHVCLE